MYVLCGDGIPILRTLHRYQRDPHVLVDIRKPEFGIMFDSAIGWLHRDTMGSLTPEDRWVIEMKWSGIAEVRRSVGR